MFTFDSREQTNDHIKKYFDRHGIPYRVAKVDVGDYVDDEHPNIVVERKKNLSELCTNLCSADRTRFYNEIRRAHDAGIKLVILCEHGGNIKTFNDIRNWVNPHGQVTGRKLQDAIFALEMAYQVPVLFCDKRSTGRRIIEILTEESHEKGILGKVDGSLWICGSP